MRFSKYISETRGFICTHDVLITSGRYDLDPQTSNRIATCFCPMCKETDSYELNHMDFVVTGTKRMYFEDLLEYDKEYTEEDIVCILVTKLDPISIKYGKRVVYTKDSCMVLKNKANKIPDALVDVYPYRMHISTEKAEVENQLNSIIERELGKPVFNPNPMSKSDIIERELCKTIFDKDILNKSDIVVIAITGDNTVCGFACGKLGLDFYLKDCSVVSKLPCNNTLFDVGYKMDKDCFYIEQVYVDDAFRCAGLASFLVDNIVRVAKYKDNVKSIYTHVRLENVAAMKLLCSKKSFYPIGEYENTDFDGKDDYRSLLLAWDIKTALNGKEVSTTNNNRTPSLIKYS